MTAIARSPFVAVDIGNTSVKVARWAEGVWGAPVSYPSTVDAPAGVWAPRLAKAGAHEGVASGVCSVVPALTARVAAGLREATGLAPSEVTESSPLPFHMGYDTPETLGHDRIAAAAAAWLLYGREAHSPVVAFDAGTAITVEAVDVDARSPVYLGGAILPGPHTLRRSLARGTAQLPEVEWERPASAIGRSTAEAIQSGLATLVLDGLAGLLARTAAELSAPPIVVASGGWGGWLARRLGTVDRVAPHLVLDGVRLLAAGDR